MPPPAWAAGRLMIEAASGVSGPREGNPFPVSSSYFFRQEEMYCRTFERSRTASPSVRRLTHDRPSRNSRVFMCHWRLAFSKLAKKQFSGIGCPGLVGGWTRETRSSHCGLPRIDLTYARLARKGFRETRLSPCRSRFARCSRFNQYPLKASSNYAPIVLRRRLCGVGAVLPSQRLVLQEKDHAACKLAGVIGNSDVPAGMNIQSFGSNAG